MLGEPLTLSADLPSDFRDVLKACLDRDPIVRWPAGRVLEALEALDTGATYLPVPQYRTARRRQEPSEAAPLAAYEISAEIHGTDENITVSASGDADCSTIIEAVRRAAPGATIVVRPGHYSGAVLLQRPVEIVGDGAAAEIVIEAVGREALTIAASGVRVRGITMISRSEMNQPKHHGIAIQTGSVRIELCDISCSSMAAVAILANAHDVSLSECTVHDGKTAGVLFEEGSSGSVSGCTLTANFGPAVHIRAGGEHTLESCGNAG